MGVPILPVETTMPSTATAMKIVCDRTALADAVSLVSGVVAARSPSPVLQCLRLTAGDGQLRLSATDLEIGVAQTIDEVDVQQEGEVLVPADKLSQIVKASDDPTLTLEADGDRLRIRGLGSNWSLHGFPVSEAPEVEDFDESITADYEVPAVILRKQIQRTLFAAANEQSRYAINGVLFERSGQTLRCVATDGRRLALSSCSCEKTTDQDGNTIVPSKALQLLGKLLDARAQGEVRVSIRDGRAHFGIGHGSRNATITSTLVEGSFPPWSDVVPKDNDIHVTMDTSSLAGAVRRAALLTSQESRGVKLTFSAGNLVITSRAPDTGEAEIRVDCNYDGDELSIGFNPGYLTDALKIIDSPEIIMSLKGPQKPGVLKADGEFIYVVMPVSLD